MADVPGKFFSAKKVRTGVSPSSPGSEVGSPLPPVNPPGSSLNSVGLSMPSAFTVANSPLTSNGTIGVTGAGTVGQYIRGDGSLADFPESSGGGSSVSYYLNGSVNQGTIGGVAYKELNKVPILGAGTDFTIAANGYIASFLTDAVDPNLLEIPGGNWNFETFFSANSGGGSPTFYVELYKYDGTTFTLIASNSTFPELIAFGTNVTAYFSTLAVPTTTLALTDRLAIRYYVTHSGRTITLHTEDNHLCQIVTTFTTGITALNGLTAQVQNFAVGTTGTDFNIASATATHTFNLPTASALNRGALSSADWTTFNNKENAITAGTTLQYFRGDKTFQTLNTAIVPELTNLYYTEARVNANTNVAANTAARHNAVTLGTANGLSLSTQILSLGLASAGVTGALSGTDWSTFNNKQNALTNPVTGTGSAGQVAYFTGTTAITGEANLFWDSTNDRLGIGTTATGNFDSVPLLVVGGGTADSGIVIYTSNATSGYLQFADGTSGAEEYRGFIKYDHSLNAMSFSTNSTARTEAEMTINSSGNVGIGTATPNIGSLVGTVLTINGTTQSNLEMASAGASRARIASSSSDTTFETRSALPLVFGTNSTARWQITSTGVFQSTGLQTIQTSTGNLTLATNGGNGNIVLTPNGTGTTTINSSVTATSFIKSGGTSSQFLKADGSVDSSTYLTTSSAASTYLPLAGGILTGELTGTNAAFTEFVTASMGFNSTAEEQAFTWQRTLGLPSDVYSLNADNNRAYLYNNTKSSFLMTWLEDGNVGIGTSTPNVSAQVEISSTTRGFLPPRMTTTQKNAIASPPAGLVIYDTTLNKLCVRAASAWQTITSV